MLKIIFFLLLIKEGGCITARYTALGEGDITHLNSSEAIFYNPAILGFFIDFLPIKSFSFSSSKDCAFSYFSTYNKINFAFGYKGVAKPLKVNKDFLFGIGYKLMKNEVAKPQLAVGLALDYSGKKLFSNFGLTLSIFEKYLRLSLYCHKFSKIRYGLGYKLKNYNIAFFISGNPFSLGVELMSLNKGGGKTSGGAIRLGYSERAGSCGIGFILPLDIKLDYAFSGKNNNHYITLSIPFGD